MFPAYRCKKKLLKNQRKSARSAGDKKTKKIVSRR
jgi:hypothetical protein